jgi:hypothetical protein
MKKLIIIFVLLTLIGCKKEKICNCGVITHDYGNTTVIYPYQTIVVKNDCSGNERVFDVIPTSVYELIFVGEKYCVINIYNW